MDFVHRKPSVNITADGEDRQEYVISTHRDGRYRHCNAGIDDDTESLRFSGICLNKEAVDLLGM